MIDAKETRYRGVTYRSKLEARWCVFFDELGIDYEYEIDSFDLGRFYPNWDSQDTQDLREELEEEGIYTKREISHKISFERNKRLFYIPDFWLPEYEHWVEIKGRYPTIQEQRKARRLAYHTGYAVNILYGNIPKPKEDWGARTEVYRSDMNIIALMVIDYGIRAMESAFSAARMARLEEIAA